MTLLARPRRYRRNPTPFTWNSRRSKWYLLGYKEGRRDALFGIADRKIRKELIWYERREGVDLVALKIRQYQKRYDKRDIMYQVGRPGGPTIKQYYQWEDGWWHGFVETVEDWYARRFKKSFAGGGRR